jgi:type IV secretory pathway VirB2 component (pilin)
MKFHESRVIALCYWFMVLAVFALLALIVIIRPAFASGDYEHDPAPNNRYFVGGNHNQTAAAVAVAAVVTCGIVSIVNKRWCWEPEPKPELPNPAGTPLTITPETPLVWRTPND